MPTYRPSSSAGGLTGIGAWGPVWATVMAQQKTIIMGYHRMPWKKWKRKHRRSSIIVRPLFPAAAAAAMFSFWCHSKKSKIDGFLSTLRLHNCCRTSCLRGSDWFSRAGPVKGAITITGSVFSKFSKYMCTYIYILYKVKFEGALPKNVDVQSRN